MRFLFRPSRDQSQPLPQREPAERPGASAIWGCLSAGSIFNLAQFQTCQPLCNHLPPSLWALEPRSKRSNSRPRLGRA